MHRSSCLLHFYLSTIPFNWIFWKASAITFWFNSVFDMLPTTAHEGTLGKPFGLVWCTVCTLVFCYWIMTDNRPPLWVNISMFELRKLWTLVRIRVREVFEETLGVRSQAEGRIIGLNLNDWRQRVSGCGRISAQSLNCILILQKIYILSTTDQASLHDFGDYNLNY